MAGPLVVDPAHIFRLSQHAFTLFCNDLLRAEAGRLGISQVHVDTTVRETVPDGGVDACVRHTTYATGWFGSRWFPEGNSVWQFKSGECPSTSKLSTEFTKSEVVAAIDRGDTYCFLTADSLGKRKKTSITKAIQKQYTARGKASIEPRVYIRDLADTLPSGFTVIAVGPFESSGQSDALQLGPLDVDELAKLLGSFVPSLGESQCRAIAARCGGSPKLVQVIAMSIAEQVDQIQSWIEIESHLDVVEYLEQRIFRTDADNPETRTLRALCLFSRLGWERELESEGRIVCEFFDLHWNEARLAAQALMRRGIVSRRGRYLYPTPDVLANYLARRTVEVLGTQQLQVLCERLGDAARAAFADRLRQLGEEPQTREIVDSLLGAEGFFVRPEDLNEPGKADLLRRLALAFPRKVVNRLWDLLGSASREQLLSLRAGRRQVVWTLEDLAWWSDTFEPATRLLLRLAWAENESIGNNATGIWTRLFQVALSGTAVPFMARFHILEDVLTDQEPQIRRLGVDALGAALRTGNITGGGGPPEDAGKLPPQEWLPVTHGEWREILRCCLSRLGQLLSDPDEGVQHAARAVLAARGSGLIFQGLLDEWADFVSLFTESPFHIRKPFLDVVSQRLRHADADNLSKGTVERLRRLEAALRGHSLGDALRRVVGSWGDELSEEDSQAGDRALTRLAQRAVADPESFAEHLDWLCSDEANASFEFGQELGQLDTQDWWFPRLVTRFKCGGGDDRFITGYLYGAKMRQGEEWLEEQLDQWVNDLELQPLVGSTTWRALSTDRAAKRLAMMLRDGSLPASYLGLLAGFWARQISPEPVIELVQVATADKSHDAVSGRLAFLAQYVKEYSESLERLGSIVQSVLADILPHPFSTRDGFYWRLLAKQLLPASPIEIAQLCVNAAQYAAQTHHLVDEHVLQVYSEAARVGGWRIFEEVLGPALLENPQILELLDLSLVEGNSLLLNYDPSLLVTWIAQDVAHRLPIIIRAVPVRGQPLSALARTILMQWGEREDVRSYFTAAFFTGAWSGPETAWLSNKLEEAQSWLQDPDPHIRAWAAELVEAIQKEREQARIHEEERGW